MLQFIVRWLVNSFALYVAERIVPGIHYEDPGNWVGLLVLALIFGLVNAFIRPVLKILTCPLIILTLGIFTLVINALMLLLAAWLGQQVGVPFLVDNFWTAVLGALIISLISFGLTLMIRENEERPSRW